VFEEGGGRGEEKWMVSRRQKSIIVEDTFGNRRRKREFWDGNQPKPTMAKSKGERERGREDWNLSGKGKR
jgi:hypothetical protein